MSASRSSSIIPSSEVVEVKARGGTLGRAVLPDLDNFQACKKLQYRTYLYPAISSSCGSRVLPSCGAEKK
jgi:hypothetical protein